MRVRRVLRPALLCGLLVIVPEVAAVPSLAPGTPVPDMRILIDVSGSMRETDPENLRIPALNLLVDLVPDGSHAGVWTFGTDASPLVPLRRVSEGWRGKARRLSGEIGSEARYTDIALALEAANEDWLGPDANPARLIILLTDGKVDISEENADNAASRAAILARLAPRLRAAGVRVYTIALSDDADLDLLERLSLATDGVSSLARSADDLLDVFLSIFTRAVEQEGLQIKGRVFHVDASIREFTALVFRPAGASDMVLHAPDGLAMRRFDHPDNVRWRDADRYNMVTVSDPATGDWLLEADLQPGSRVNIITELRLRVTGLPGNIVQGERPELRAWFEEDGEPVTDSGFLDLFEVAAHLRRSGETQEVLALGRIDGASADGPGRFGGTLGGLGEPGEYEILVRANGGTITREKVLPVRVVGDLFDIAVEAPLPDRPLATIRVKAEAGFVVPGDTRVRARVTRPDGLATEIPAGYDAVDGAWRLDIAMPGPGVYGVDVEIASRSVHGREIAVRHGPLTFGEPVPGPAPAPEPAVTPQPAPAPAPEPERPSPLRLLLILGVLGIAGAAGVLLVWRKRRAAVPEAEVVAGGVADRTGGAGGDDASTGVEIELTDPPAMAPGAGPAGGTGGGRPVGPAYEGRAEEVTDGDEAESSGVAGDGDEGPDDDEGREDSESPPRR